MKTLFYILFSAFLLIFVSCQRESSEDVNQDKIYTEYSLVYDANTDITYARALFKFSNITGTQLELKAPAEVKFDNDILAFNQTLAYYEKQYVGVKTGGTFTYKDLDNNTFTNTITGVKSIGFPTGLDSIHKSSSYQMVWVGDSLITGEGVTVTINGINEGDAQIFYTNSVNANSITFPLNKLQLLGTGSGTMFMQRDITKTLQQATSAGGYIKGVYKPANLPIQIAN